MDHASALLVLSSSLVIKTERHVDAIAATVVAIGSVRVEPHRPLFKENTAESTPTAAITTLDCSGFFVRKIRKQLRRLSYVHRFVSF
jgi:hypothetical protein